MAAKYREVGRDHKGNELAAGISGMLRTDTGMSTAHGRNTTAQTNIGSLLRLTISGHVHREADRNLPAET